MLNTIFMGAVIKGSSFLKQKPCEYLKPSACKYGKSEHLNSFLHLNTKLIFSKMKNIEIYKQIYLVNQKRQCVCGSNSASGLKSSVI